MRIDQLPVAESVSNANTLPVNVAGMSQQVSVGDLTNSIRDNVYGAPLTAATASGMTDQTRVYVYTGNETGYVNGDWYYYNGSAWVSGGAYNSVAVQTDPTLMLAGVPADAKATGDALAEKAEMFVVSNVTETTRNLWLDGDISVDTTGLTQFVLRNPLPAGTYTISCKCTTTYTAQTYSVIRFSKLQDASAMSSFLNTLQIPHDGVRHPVTFTISETAYSVRFLSAPSVSASNGYTSSWVDIQVESGSAMTNYIQPLSAIDAVVREELETEHHTGVIGPILDVAETYFNVGYATNDQLIYLTQHGPYSTPLDNGVKAIACSQFALACLSGMKYNRSVYAQSTNQSEWWGYHSDGTGTYPFDNDYMINQYWVQYLSAKGLLIPYVAGHHNIKAGDLLFFGTDIAQNGGHCMIATQINPARICTIEATGSQTRLIDNASVGVISGGINLATYPPVYYAHLPIAPTEYTTKRILLDATAQSGTIPSGSSSSTFKTYTFDQVQERGFYTIVVDKTDAGAAGIYARAVYDNAATENVLFGDAASIGCTLRCTFYAQMPMASIMLRLAGSGGDTCTINRVAVYRGWHD